MAVSPAGSISLSEAALRTMLSTVAAFQTFAGAGDAAAALAKIHLGYLPDPADLTQYTLAELQGYRPYAIVYLSELDGYRSRLIGEPFSFDSAGRVMIHLEQDASGWAGNRPTRDADQEFLNAVGGIVDGLREIRGVAAGHLQFRSIRLVLGPVAAHPDEVPAVGLYQRAVLQLDWGTA